MMRDPARAAKPRFEKGSNQSMNNLKQILILGVLAVTSIAIGQFPSSPRPISSRVKRYSSQSVINAQKVEKLERIGMGLWPGGKISRPARNHSHPPMV